MVQIPEFLIDHPGLSVYERAVIPLIIRHGMQWGRPMAGVDAQTVSQAVGMDVRQSIAVLDELCDKRILERKTVQHEGQRRVVYLIAKALIEGMAMPQPKPEAALSLDKERFEPWYFINMPKEQYTALKAFAMQLLHSLSLPEDVFTDFELYQRSQNRKSHDWQAEFQRWAMREQRKRETTSKPAVYDESFKPTPEQFRLTQYFIAKLRKLDPQFIEPTDWSWAQQIKTLVEIEGYEEAEITKAIDWLFSSKGDWYRPNVPDAFALRKKFSYIVSHTRSYREGRQQLPPEANIFDLLEKE